MNARYERHCRRLLRAYPPRFRERHGEELVGTMLDAAAPGRDRPPVRDVWDVIRSGLLFRLRDRPPVHRWLAYRLLGAGLPERWRWWVRDDVLGRGHALRSHVGNVALMSLVLFALNLPSIDPGWLLTYVPATLVIGMIPIPPLNRAERRRILTKHGFTPDSRARGVRETR